MTNCTICGRAPSSPFRVYDERGRVTLGCIDASHDGALVTPSESARWHYRPEAKKWRAASAARLKKLLAGGIR